MSNEEKEPFLVSIIPFAGLALLLAIALAWRYFPEQKASGSEANPELSEQALKHWLRAIPVDIPENPEGDFARGPENAPVTIVEFSDFQCPFCKTATSSVDEVVERFGDDVRVVFKNFPLDDACNERMSQPLHVHACRAAYLARCAEEQGKGLFWKAHNALFGTKELTDYMLNNLPAELGLDETKLASCMGAERTKAAVQADLDAAHDMRLSSTPSFFINGKKVSDYRDGSLIRIVEAALKTAP